MIFLNFFKFYYYVPGERSCVATKYLPLSGWVLMSMPLEALESLELCPWVSSGMSRSGLVELQVDKCDMDI